MTTETTQQSEHTPLEKPLGRCMGWHCSEERPKLLARIERLEEALIAALPYIESAEEDEHYKPGVVAKVTKQLRAALTE